MVLLVNKDTQRTLKSCARVDDFILYFLFRLVRCCIARMYYYDYNGQVWTFTVLPWFEPCGLYRY
jgi:hypothetical protein